MSDYGYVERDPSGADFEKDPDEAEDYGFSWAGRLNGDTIATSTFLLPDGLTEVSSSNDDTSAVVFVSGGSAGMTYRITNRIVTDGGRTWEKTIRVLVRDS